jgi:hypothetical protein
MRKLKGSQGRTGKFSFLLFRLTWNGTRVFRSAKAEVSGSDLPTSTAGGHTSSASPSTHLLCLRVHSRTLQARQVSRIITFSGKETPLQCTTNAPKYPGVDPRIAQLHGEGSVGTTCSWTHPRVHSPSMKRLDPTAKKGPQNLHAREPPLQQSSNGLQQGLKPTEVCLSHAVPPAGMGDGVATREHGEWHVSVIR